MYCDAFVINHIKSKKLTEDRIRLEFAEQLQVKDMITYEIQLKENDRSFALIFKQRQSLEDMCSLFPHTRIFGLEYFNTYKISKRTTHFVTHTPQKYDDKEEFKKLASKFGEVKKLITTKGVHIVQFEDNNASTAFYHLFPLIDFEGGVHAKVCSNCFDVPLVHISNIPAGLEISQLQEYLENEAHVVRIFEQPSYNDDSSYSVNVLFEDNNQANHVIDELNYSRVSDQLLLFTHFAMKDEIEKIKDWELRVSGLPETMDCNELNARFSQFGRVFSVFINKKPVFGRVDFILQKDAMAAAAFFSNPESHESLQVVYSAENSFLTVFVYNLPFDITKRELAELFPEASERRVFPNKERGFPPTVVLYFDNEESGRQAVERGSAHFERGLRLFCIPFISRERLELEKERRRDEGVGASIYITNLRFRTEYEDVVDMCAEFGTLERVSLKRRNGRHDAVAIVQFTGPEAMQACLDHIGEFEIDGWVPKAEVYDPEKPRDSEKPERKKLPKSRGEANAQRKAPPLTL